MMKISTRLEQLFEKLGFNKDNGLFFLTDAEDWIHKFPYRISKILRDSIKPDVVYSIFHDIEEEDHPKPINQSFILFFDNPSEEKELEIHRKIFNLGQTQAIFINRDNTLDLYHGNDFLLESKLHKKVTSSSNLDDFKEFSFSNILLGKHLDVLGKKKEEVDVFLLRNITDARKILIAKDGLQLNPKVANRLIGRLLFISYLIDRNVSFNDQSILEGKTKFERKAFFKDLIKDKENLYNFFEYLTSKYDGDMFPLQENSSNSNAYNEKSNINTEHLDVLFHLFSCSSFFKKGNNKYNGYTVQPSLFDLYDFSILPVELISSIYETFINDENEEILLSKQKAVKAYYTPPFLVDYVLSQTVVPYLRETLPSNKIKCKVLDPACGSGIFLVETTRKLIEKEISTSASKKLSDSTLWELIKNNIFGIDIDLDAIDISIFSLYITILDYKQPAEIENFKFQRLKNENFFGGEEADFFNLNHPFNQLLTDIDFIIGNPPWGKVKQSCYKEYIKNKNKLDNEGKPKSEKLKIAIGDDICQAFLIRVNDFYSKKTKTKNCLIVSSKVLYNSHSTSKSFRNYFLNKVELKQVLELSQVNNKTTGGHQVFENAKQSTVILKFNLQEDKKKIINNIIQHISVKPNKFFKYWKTIVIEKNDVKKIKQSYLMPSEGGNDWIWKILVFGNALDIHFIKRLKISPKQTTINQLLDDNALVRNGGLKIKDGKIKKDSSKFSNFKYLDAEKDFRPYLAHPYKTWQKELDDKKNVDFNIGYIPNEKFFSGLKLIIKKGLNLDPKTGEHHLGCISSVVEEDMVFTATVCSIISDYKTSTTEMENILYNLSALFNSKLFTFFLLHTGSSIGIERSRVNFRELFEFPAILDDEISELAKEITISRKDPFNKDFEKFKNQLDNKIYSLYNISPIEKSLIDYAFEVSIPVLFRKNSKMLSPLEFQLKQDKEFILLYVSIFESTFNKKYQNSNKRVNTKVTYSEDFIRVDFVLSKKSQTKTLFQKESNDDISLILGDLSFHEASKDLYLQQDVRGFTDESFYLIKPNEKKLWHTAIAYLDALEIDEAITKAEINHITSNVY